MSKIKTMQLFPHLLPEEVKIWNRFLRKYRNFAEQYKYDVRVGEGTDIGPAAGENYQRMAKMLSQKRIDVVGYRDGAVLLIEIKPDAGIGALGQLEAYKMLFRRDMKYEGSLELVLVTDNIDVDSADVMVQAGINIYVV